MWLQFTWPTACPMWCSMEVEMTENTCVIPGNVLLSISFLILFLSHSVSFDVWIYMASHISIFVHKASKWRLEGLGMGLKSLKKLHRWNLWKNHPSAVFSSKMKHKQQKKTKNKKHTHTHRPTSDKTKEIRNIKL